ncbi:MAG TPA: aldehyde dehydrogenase family protein [Polyangiales bacterium]|nr:aldehyde dehydrogenase family protein [Polyangiales bacterium]
MSLQNGLEPVDARGFSAREQSVEARGGVPAAQMLAVRAPATGEWLGEVRTSSAEQVNDAFARARVAQLRWVSLPIELRCEHIMRLRDAIVARADELIDLMAREAGKPRQEALVHEVMVVADLANYYAKRAAKILAPREVEPHLFKHRKSYVHYAPRGVIGVISPSNFPLLVAASEAIVALLAGNAVVHKPSERTPLVALKFQDICVRAGLPCDLYQVLPGARATGEALIDARPDMLFFTGCQANGRAVAAHCGSLLIPVQLELGGKASAIVLEDADLERAARAIVNGAFANSGQVCVGVQRVYAQAAIHDALVQRVVELSEHLRQGDPDQRTVDLGPLQTVGQADRAEQLVDEARQRGAVVRSGGLRGAARNVYLPTVLAQCTPEMRLMREELMAPVLAVMKVASDNEAIVLCNQSRSRLMASVFTSNKQRGRRIAERLHMGTVMINDVLAAYASPELPFGGIGDSGHGRVHGDEGLRAVCDTRTVDYNRGPMFKREPVWFPYRKRTYATMINVMKVFFRSGSPLKNAIDLL